MWHVYMIRNEREALYTGITTDVERRVSAHREGSHGAARYMRTCRTVNRVYSCRIGGRSLAARVEHRIKRMKKTQKERLVSEAPGRRRLLALLGIKP